MDLRAAMRLLVATGVRLLNAAICKSPSGVVLHGIPDLEDGVVALGRELVARGYSVTILVEDPSAGPRVALAISTQVKIVPKRSIRALRTYLRSRYVFMTHGLFFDTEPPASQCVVNIWHGEPPGKVVGRFENRPGRSASVAPVMSSIGQAYRASEFGLHPSRVPVIGAPRNDRLLTSDGAKVRKILFETECDKRIYLWMPTFRATKPGRYARVDAGRMRAGVPFNDGDLSKLDSWLTANNHLIVVKRHPWDVDSLSDGYQSIRSLDQSDLESVDLSVYGVLKAFDGLLTDVSSIWLDFLLLNKPILFPFPDIDDYRGSRGINLEPYDSWIPGPLVMDIGALIDELEALSGGLDRFESIRTSALNRHHRYNDASSVTRLLDFIGASRR